MTRIIFFGTTEHSTLMLEKLLQMKDIAVPLIITKKGKPAGRGLKALPSPIALFANEHGVPVTEIEKTQEAAETLKKLNPDLFFVVDFGKIIPQDILNIPSKGTINFHPSLLPQYRGPSPIIAPILNGDTETGFSFMLLDAEMDHGPILYQKKIAIDSDDTAGTLEKKLFERGIEKLEYVMTKYLSGKIEPTEQDHSKATTTKLIKKEDALVNFTKESAEVIERKVRAYNPWPFAYFFHNGKRIQIINVSMCQPTISPAHQFTRTEDGVVACCANNTFLILKTIKPEGKQIRTSKEFEQYF